MFSLHLIAIRYNVHAFGDPSRRFIGPPVIWFNSGLHNIYTYHIYIYDRAGIVGGGAGSKVGGVGGGGGTPPL